MKIFIFERIAQCSWNYHPAGGLVIIAEDIEMAKELIKVDSNITIDDSEWKSAEIFELSQDITPKYWVMPDAGCC